MRWANAIATLNTAGFNMIESNAPATILLLKSNVRLCRALAGLGCAAGR